MQQLQCLLILPSQLKLPRKVKGLCKSHITTNCVLPLLFFTDLEGYESVQSQDQMGRRYKTYNPGEQTAFFAHISPLSVLAFAKLQYNHPVTCAAFSFFFWNTLCRLLTKQIIFLSLCWPVISFPIKFGKKTSKEKETEQFDSEVSELNEHDLSLA